MEPTHTYENGQVKPVQKRWFRTDVNFENSFKFWFALQWQNHYIQIFLVTFAITIYELCRIGWIADIVAENYADEGFLGGLFATIGCLIPPAISAIIAYKGFYQFFDDLKHGTSR